MKYFKKEMWAGFRSSSEKEWNRRLLAYKRQLAKVVPRLNATARDFFKKISLHDARLISFFVVENEKGLGEPPCDVQINANDCYGTMYTLLYKWVQTIELSFPSEKPLFPSTNRGFGDWGYDELTRVKDQYRHEVLFSSGATILLEFQDFKYATKAIRTAKFEGGDPSHKR